MNAGTPIIQKRRVTYRLYPSKQQSVVMEEMRILHQQLYNACLQERISAYKQEKKSISYIDQTQSITIIRAEHPEYEAINAQSLQVTAKRLDLAFEHFFRRLFRVVSGAYKYRRFLGSYYSKFHP